MDAQELVRQFGALGLAAGEGLIVHSSLRSLGHVDGGPDAVIDALLETIGPEGNLMLPTFNYSVPAPEPCYDPEQTPCRTGMIPETGRKRPGTVRSLHPTHSVAVIGPDAEELTRDHLAGQAFGIGSPIDRLIPMDGKILLIGVGHTSNSAVHVAEAHAGIPKRQWKQPPPSVSVRTPDGRIITHELDASPSCSAAFGAVEHALRMHNDIRDGRIGGALCQFMSGRDVVKRVCEIVEQKPDILLCTRPQCGACAAIRDALRP